MSRPIPINHWSRSDVNSRLVSQPAPPPTLTHTPLPTFLAMSQGPSGANHTHTAPAGPCSYQLSTPRVLCRLLSVFVCVNRVKGCRKVTCLSWVMNSRKKIWGTFKDIYLHSTNVKTKLFFYVNSCIFALNNQSILCHCFKFSHQSWHLGVNNIQTKILLLCFTDSIINIMWGAHRL